MSGRYLKFVHSILPLSVIYYMHWTVLLYPHIGYSFHFTNILSKDNLTTHEFQSVHRSYMDKSATPEGYETSGRFLLSNNESLDVVLSQLSDSVLVRLVCCFCWAIGLLLSSHGLFINSGFKAIYVCRLELVEVLIAVLRLARKSLWYDEVDCSICCILFPIGVCSAIAWSIESIT